jgi:hypothetical protein
MPRVGIDQSRFYALAIPLRKIFILNEMLHPILDR